jgi:predicted negative regulator of RcsB-dependent stress response
MIVAIIITVMAFLTLFGFMYWLADKVDKEQEQINQYNEWLRQQQQYYFEGQGQHGYGSWL